MLGKSIDLSGAWHFALDPEDRGKAAGWHNQKLSETVQLPGTTDSNEQGKKNTTIERGRLTRRYTYHGAAWYQKTIHIPEAWRGKVIHLRLERVLWLSEAWVDDTPLGQQESLCTPHCYVLGELAPGEHRLTLCVDNRMYVEVGEWACALTEQTQTAWNGIIGGIHLHATEPAWLKQLRIFPDAASQEVRIRGSIDQERAKPYQLEVRVLSDKTPQKRLATKTFKLSSEEATLDFDVRLSMDVPVEVWDEFHPTRYRLALSMLDAEGALQDRREVPFGFRTLETLGKQLRLNQRKLFLRGNVDGGLFPLTGHVPMDHAFWRGYFETLQDYGMNHVRFHSWCPPEAAFEMADQLGFLIHVEAPMWRPHGDISPFPELCAFIRAETVRILDRYGNHPSFCFFAFGNELGAGDDPFLLETLQWCQQYDPRHLYTTTMRQYETDQPDDFFKTAMVEDIPVRGEGRIGITRPDTTHDYEAVIAHANKPIIAHENGQFAMYPYFLERHKYVGPLRARHYDVFERDLVLQGMGRQLNAFSEASGTLSCILYKEELEASLRSPSMSGFQMLGLTDIQGWGTATIGMMDALRDSKGIISPTAWRSFCAPVVPLARFEKFTWTSDETLEVTAEAVCYSAGDYGPVGPGWALNDDNGDPVVQDNLPETLLRTGGKTVLGKIEIALRELPAPAHYTLQLRLDETHFNEWSLWIYPERVQTEPFRAIQVRTAWDDETRALAAEGANVLLLPQQESLTGGMPGRLAPIFWSQSLFASQPGQMGILCDHKHPALEQFPTQAHADWQWWELLDQSKALIMDTFPASLQPIVQPIDTFQRNHRLGMVFEACVGKGKVLCSSIDLETDLASRPVARQLRSSLLTYMASEAFSPKVHCELGAFDTLFSTEPRIAFHDTLPPIGETMLDVTPELPEHEASDEMDSDPMEVQKAGFEYLVLQPTARRQNMPAWKGESIMALLYCPHDFAGVLYFQLQGAKPGSFSCTLNGKEMAHSLTLPEESTWASMTITPKDSCFEVLHLDLESNESQAIFISRFLLCKTP